MKQITLVRYVRFPDAVFLERINDLADVLSVVASARVQRWGRFPGEFLCQGYRYP